MLHKVLYSKFFPPPKFLKRPSVSLEILPSGINYLLLKDTANGLVPDVFGSVPLPEGAMSANRIVKKELVIKALVDIREKTGVSFVRFSLPEEDIYLFKTHVPELKPKEIHDILDFKIEENIPLSAKEAVFDYEIIPNLKKTPGLDIMVFAASLGVVEEFYSIFEAAGLTPMIFSPESNNVARSLIKGTNEQIIVIVNIRESKIFFSLIVFGVVMQTSSINFGSSAFVDSLVKHYNISYPEALKIKNEKLYNDNPDSMEIFSYLINTISAIKDEVYRYVSYCNERKDLLGRVDRVILCGRDSMIVGFEKYLSMNLNLKVEIANVWTNNFDLNEYVPEISRVDSLDLAALNGLSLI